MKSSSASRPLGDSTYGAEPLPMSGRVLSAGILLGAGLGGFLDGILLHQLLQWHNMISAIRPPDDLVSMKVNMLWDGVFHAFAWCLTVFGLFRLWAVSRAGAFQATTGNWVGALLIGWGLFNVAEGIVDHFLLRIHHVHPGEGELAWDIGFVALGLAMLGSGMALARVRRQLRNNVT